MRAGHLHDGDVPATGEAFIELARLGGSRVELIVSSSTPDPAEQRQTHDEWVAVLVGSATLELAGERRSLAAGDWLLIPAGAPHRVLGTEAGTRWLAVHGPAAQEPADQDSATEL